MKTLALTLLLTLSACGGSPTFSLQPDPSGDDAGDPRKGTTSPGDASGDEDAADAPSSSPDAGEPAPDARADAGDPPGPEAGQPDAPGSAPDASPDAAPDAGAPETVAECVAAACAAYGGACGTFDVLCGGVPTSYGCGSCLPGKACGDDGDEGVCGDACVATTGTGTSSGALCNQLGYATTWVTTGCSSTPWISTSSGPVFRALGTSGCATIIPAGGGESVQCCPE